MSRMPMITVQTACEAAAPTLESIHKKFGAVPNFFGALANNGTALNAYLDFEEAIESNSRLTTAQQEMISLAVANKNGCQYCVSGHTFSAKHAGVNQASALRAQTGQAEDPLDQAVLSFALAMREYRGAVPESILTQARNAGLNDQLLVEITTWTLINTYSNWINNLIQPKIDFPLVPLV